MHHFNYFEFYKSILHKYRMQASKTIRLTQLLDTINEVGFIFISTQVYDSGKTPFFFDSTGNAEVFLKYSASICYVAKLQIGVIMGSSIQDAKDEMRQTFVGAMKYGKNLCLHIDKIAPKFDSGKLLFILTMRTINTKL